MGEWTGVVSLLYSVVDESPSYQLTGGQVRWVRYCGSTGGFWLYSEVAIEGKEAKETHEVLYETKVS